MDSIVQLCGGLVIACLVGIFLPQLPEMIRNSQERQRTQNREYYGERYRHLGNQVYEPSSPSDQIIRRLCELEAVGMRRDSQSDEEIAVAERWWRENHARVQKWLADREQFTSQHGAKPKHSGIVPANAEKEIYVRTPTYTTLKTIYYAVRSSLENRTTYSWLPAYSKTEHLRTPSTRHFDGSEWISDGGDWADYTTYHVYPFVPNPDYKRQMNLRAEDEGKDFNTASQAVMKQFEALPGHLQSKY